MRAALEGWEGEMALVLKQEWSHSGSRPGSHSQAAWAAQEWVAETSANARVCNGL